MTPEEQLVEAKRILMGRDWYYFNELSPTAQDWAVNNQRCPDNWHDPLLDDMETMLTALGVSNANIDYSGFSSQGDGAYFTGRYAYNPGALGWVKGEYPRETALHRCVATLQDIQRRNFYQVVADVKHRGHYLHEYETRFEVERCDDKALAAGTEETITDTMRDLMGWCYRRLEAEYEYVTGEGAWEYLMDSEYEYNADGTKYNGPYA